MSTPKKKLKVKRAKPLIQQLPDSGNYEDGNSKFARALASNDYQTRAKGLEALTRWLSRKSEVSQQDMLKIWKSLYYCFWHSDKAPVQEDLAVTLAKVLLDLSEEVAFTYYAAFVETMRREWFGIDRHRLDKFLLLVRHFLAHLFCLLRAHHWDLALVQRYTRHMEQHVLLPSDGYKAAGFSYHLADIFLPELLKEAAKAPPPSAPLEALLEPFAEAMCHCAEAAALNRYRESVFSPVVEEVHSPGEGAPLGQLAVQALSDLLFGLGAQPGVVARNRDVLYSTSKALEKAARKRAKLDQEAAGAEAAGAPEQQQKGKKKKKQQQQEAEKEAPTPAPAQQQEQQEQQEQQQQEQQEVTPEPKPASKKRKKQQAGAVTTPAATTTLTPSPTPLQPETPLEPPPSNLTPKPTKRTRSKAAPPAPTPLTPNGTPNGTPLPTPLQTPVANHISNPTPLGNHLYAGHTPAHIPPTTTQPTTKSSKRKKDSHVAFQTPPPSTTPDATPERPANPTPSPAATPLPLSPVQPDFSTPNGASPGPPGHTPYASSHAPPTTGPAGSTPAAVPATRSHHKKKATALLFGTPTPSPLPSTPPPAQQTPPSPAATPPGPSEFQFLTPVSETPDTPTLLKGGRPGSTPNPLKRKSATPAAGSEAVTPPQNGSGRMKTRKSSTPSKSAGPSTTKKKVVVINLRRNQEFAHGSPAPQGTPIPQPKGILKHSAAVPNSAPPKSTASRASNGNGTAKPFLTPNKKHYPKAATFFL